MTKRHRPLHKKLIVLLAACVMALCFAAPVYAARLNAKSVTILAGKSYSLKLKGTKKKARWISSDQAVATVTQKGVVKAVKPGKATITATVGKARYRCSIVVTQPVTSLRLDQTAVTLKEKGASLTVKATVSTSAQSASAVSTGKAKNVLIVGDSYAYGVGDGSSLPGWARKFAAYSGCKLYLVAQRGAGFYQKANKYAVWPGLNLLESLKKYEKSTDSLNPKEIDLIIVQSGYNDSVPYAKGKVSKATIRSRVQQFFNYCGKKYPNAKLFLIYTPLPSQKVGPAVKDSKKNLYYAYVQGAGASSYSIAIPASYTWYKGRTDL